MICGAVRNSSLTIISCSKALGVGKILSLVGWDFKKMSNASLLRNAYKKEQTFKKMLFLLLGAGIFLIYRATRNKNTISVLLPIR